MAEITAVDDMLFTNDYVHFGSSLHWVRSECPLGFQGSTLNFPVAQTHHLTHLHELPGILVFHLVFCSCRQQNLIGAEKKLLGDFWMTRRTDGKVREPGSEKNWNQGISSNQSPSW